VPSVFGDLVDCIHGGDDETSSDGFLDDGGEDDESLGFFQTNSWRADEFVEFALSPTADGVVGQETYKTLVECICERIGGVVGDKVTSNLSKR
jgi:hypothetical protein